LVFELFGRFQKIKKVSKSLENQGITCLFDSNRYRNVVKNQIALDKFHLIQHINRGATVLQI
jgi:hypothetical protein